MHFGEIGSDFQRLFEMLDGLLDLPLADAGESGIVVRAGVARFGKFDGLFVKRRRLSGASLADARHAQSVVAHPGIWICINYGLEYRSRLVKAPLREKCLTPNRKSLQTGGPDLQQPLSDRIGFVHPAHLPIDIGKASQRFGLVGSDRKRALEPLLRFRISSQSPQRIAENEHRLDMVRAQRHRRTGAGQSIFDLAILRVDQRQVAVKIRSSRMERNGALNISDGLVPSSLLTA